MSQKNLMQILYDYLDAMFIGEDTKDAVLQILPLGISINPSDFENPVTPTNVEEGALATSENFSNMVNDIPEAQAKFVAKGKLEEVYAWVLNNTIPTKDTGVSQERKEAYDKAMKLLNDEVEVNSKKSYVQSQRYKDYNEKKAAYEQAIYNRNYESIMADRSTSKLQKLWLTKKRILDNNVSSAYKELEMYNDVEQALAIVQTSFTQGVTQLIASEKEYFDTSSQESDTGKNWHICNAFPSNWYENDDMYAKVKIDQNTSHENSNSKFLKVQADMSLKVGIVSVNASTEHEHSELHEDKNSSVSAIELEIAAVRIDRPWLNEALFSLDGWKIQDHKIGSLSDGTFPGNAGMMPLLPKFMLVARNVTLKGEFSSDTLNEAKDRTKIDTAIGVGPFKANGHTEFGQEKKSVDSELTNSSITIKTPQIIGFISSVVPRTPKNE